MARKRRIFGPLTYVTLALAALACAYSGHAIYRSELDAWLELRWATAQIRSDDPAKRTAAENILAGQPAGVARPHFLALLDDPRAEVREHGVRALIRTSGDPAELASALVASADDKEVAVRLEAAKGLGEALRLIRDLRFAKPPAAEIKPSALRALRKLLGDPEPEVREEAAEALEHAGPDDASVASLGSALGDPVPGVRLAAIRALLTLRGKDDEPAVGALVGLVADPRPRIDRALCAQVLTRVGDRANERAVLGLAGLLSSEDGAVRSEALECLQSIGPRARAALPALETLFGDGQAQDRHVAVDVILAILPEKDPKALALRLGAIGDPNLPVDHRVASIQQLRRVDVSKLPEVATILVGQLSDPTEDVRLSAYQLLGLVVQDTPAPKPPAPSPSRP